jgi:hypothetical protein
MLFSGFLGWRDTRDETRESGSCSRDGGSCRASEVCDFRRVECRDLEDRVVAIADGSRVASRREYGHGKTRRSGESGTD